MYIEDTIVAPATPPGRGAVAIVRLSGPRAFEILRAIWKPRTSRDGLGARRLYLGDIIDPKTCSPIDRALAVTMPGPQSLTGEDVAELHCHGGPYLVRRVVGLALACGARIAGPGEFSRRAFLNGRIDLTEAEAVADLVEAHSDSALQQALAQLNGALTETVRNLRSRLISIRAHLEAEIDFGDEDISLPTQAERAAALEKLGAELELLHDSFARGRLVREGAVAAIIGKPNVGKSSILNLLLGVDRAIVTPIPGTTRDVIEDTIQLGPYTLVLQDTAGIREGADEVERIGVERSRKSLSEADLVIAVFDSSRALDDQDRAVAEQCKGRPGIALLNKQDLARLVSSADLETTGLAMPIMPFSARTALEVPALKTELTRMVDAMAGGSAVEGVAISRMRHREALARASAALGEARTSVARGMPPEIIAVDVARAGDELGRITGEIHSEDLLDAIFREFCIGK